MSGTGLHTQLEDVIAGTERHTPSRNAPPHAGWFPILALETWWLKIPRRLRSYSPMLWAVWSDGMYLTAWPRVSLALPWATMLLGFLEGATHWSLLTIGDNQLSASVRAVALPQILPMLFAGVLLGSLSAHLGLMLLVGYAIGDYLVAGPFLSISPWTPISGFLCLRVPQLLCYALFFAVAVVPVVAGEDLLRPLTRRLASDRPASTIIRVGALAVVVMTLVYGWTLAAPLSFRVVWSWADTGPPITVKYFDNVLNPWLPIMAGLGILARGLLIWRRRSDEQLRGRVKRLREESAVADQTPGWTRCLPVWLRAVFTAVASGFLLAGMITNWLLAVLVCTVLVSFFLLRNCILPKLPRWAKWARRVNTVPLIVRTALIVVATYFATLGLLQLPGWATAANRTPGQFGTLLSCLGVSLLIILVAVPFLPEDLSGAIKPTGLRLPIRTIRVTAHATLVILFLFLPARALAVCLDPSCCLGDNGSAAGALGAMGGALAVGAAGGLGAGGEGQGPSGSGPSGDGGQGPSGGSGDGGPGDGGSPSGSGPSGESGQGPSGGSGDGGPSDGGSSSDSGPSGESGQGPSLSSGDGGGDSNSESNQAAQDQQDADLLAQQAAQDQQGANELAQQATQDQQDADLLAQQAAQDQQDANQLAQEAATEQDPETAAAERDAAKQLAADAAAEQDAAKQLADDAAAEQDAAKQLAEDAAAEQEAAKQLADAAAEQAAAQAAQAQEVAQEMAKEAAAAQAKADQAQALAAALAGTPEGAIAQQEANQAQTEAILAREAATEAQQAADQAAAEAAQAKAQADAQSRATTGTGGTSGSGGSSSSSSSAQDGSSKIPKNP